MDKVGELKQKARIPKDTLLALLSVISKDESAINMEKDKKYRFTESELAEYANEVKQEYGKEQFSEGHSIGYQRGKNEANIRNKRGY